MRSSVEHAQESCLPIYGQKITTRQMAAPGDLLCQMFKSPRSINTNSKLHSIWTKTGSALE